MQNPCHPSELICRINIQFCSLQPLIEAAAEAGRDREQAAKDRVQSLTVVKAQAWTKGFQNPVHVQREGRFCRCVCAVMGH